MKKRILILGAFGKIGEAVVKDIVQGTDYELLALSKFSEDKGPFWKDYHVHIDILDFPKLKNTVLDYAPDVIINAAGYTKVDLAEEERSDCWKLNVDLVNRLSRFAAILDSHLIHLSSDYIFDGNNGPYSENANPSPTNFYGKSKLAAENILISADINKTIVRTNFLYGLSSIGKLTFVDLILNALFSEARPVVVNSFYSNPVLTTDIAFGIRHIIEKEYTGIINFAGPDYLSRYQIALKVAEVFSLDSSLITPVEISDLSLLAPRPIRAGLLTSKAVKDLGIAFQGLEEGLKEYKSQLELQKAILDPKNTIILN
jgi:dTDP-4-dehydrorhamnose reductase